MKYLGKYQHIKHLLEDGQYYLIYYQDNLNLNLSLGTKIRIILLVKYIGMGCATDRFSIFIIYENTYMNLDHKIYFLKSESNNGKNSHFFENDDIFLLNEYDIGCILMKLV